MNELTKPIKDIIDRGKSAQRKTVEGILEFGLCVSELKETAKSVSGGSNFAKLCADEWGISQPTSSLFLGIGLNYAELISSTDKLPNNVEPIAYLAGLESVLRGSIIEAGIIAADTTQADIRAYKRLIKMRQTPVNQKEVNALVAEVKEFKENKEKVDKLEKARKAEEKEFLKEQVKITKEGYKKAIEAAEKKGKAEQKAEQKAYEEACKKADDEAKANQQKEKSKWDNKASSFKDKRESVVKIVNALNMADEDLVSKVRKYILQQTHTDKGTSKYEDVYKELTRGK